MSGCEALALSGRAACTKPLLAAVFLFDFQRVEKYFENFFEKSLQLSKQVVYLYQIIIKK